MKNNSLNTAWATLFVALSMYGCQGNTPAPAEQAPQTETPTQENTSTTLPRTQGEGTVSDHTDTDAAIHNEATPESDADATKENLTVDDWNQYHLDHCWPYQKDERCNEEDWDRFHDYLKNHALNYDSVQSLFHRYEHEIGRTAKWLKEEADSCYERVEDSDACNQDELWNSLINDIEILRSLDDHNHPKEQYALWKLLDEVQTESDDEDKPHKSDEQFREELRALVKAGANVNDTNKDGIIPAFVIKDKIILREFIQSGVINPKLTDKQDRPLLHVLAGRGDIDADFIKQFIAAGVDINATDKHDRTLLHVLSERGDINADFIKQLTAAGVDINARDDQGNTPLGSYLWENKPDESISQSFMEAGADIYAANKKGDIPLFKLPPDLVLKLIENGKIKLDDKDAHGNTLIHIFGHHAGLVIYAMKNGFDFASRNDKGEMPVFDMEASAVLELLKSQKISPDIRSNDGKTLLHIYANHEELAKYLIDAGLDINAKDNDGNTVLHDKDVSLATVQQLVKLGANINAQNKNGETPLMILCGDLECVKKLMELGADVKLRDANGDDYVMRRLIHFPDNENDYYYYVDLFYQGDTNEILEHLQSAISYKFTKISKHFSKVYFKKLRYAIEYADGDACSATIDEVHDVGRDLEKLVPQLIDAGLDVHQEDKDTSMHLGAGDTYLFFDLPLACESLIQAGLKVNAKNKRGETPLHQPLGLEMMKALIKAGADVNAKDDLGRTPLFYNIQKVEGDMCEYFHVLNKEVADYLLEAGANINEKDKNGRTALFYIYNDIHGDPAATLKYLAEHGIDLNAVDNGGKTALFSLPTRYRDRDITWEDEACPIYEAFVKNGGKLDAKDKYGRNVLFYKPQLVECFKKIAAQNPSAQLDIKKLVNEPDNDGVKPLMYMYKGEFINSFKNYFLGIYAQSPGIYREPEEAEFKAFYLGVMKSLVESGADIGCGWGGTLSEDMCVCGNLRYSQADASQWTCLGDQVRCLQHDGCTLLGKKYPAASELCDADKKVVKDHPCSERWMCDAESCDCHQITIHSGDICVSGGVLADNNGIYETQDDYNNRMSKCGGKPMSDVFIAKEEDANCKEGNWYCSKSIYYDLQKQSWMCGEGEKDSYCDGQPMPGAESDKSSYVCIYDKWVCVKESCFCRTSLSVDNPTYSTIGNQKVCDLSGMIPHYSDIRKYRSSHNYYDDDTIECPQDYKYSPSAEKCIPRFCPNNALYNEKIGECHCPDGYIKYTSEWMDCDTFHYPSWCIEADCEPDKRYDPKTQTCVCPKNSAYNYKLHKCVSFNCPNGKCQGDYAKTCFTDIHSCIEDCPKGYIYDIRKDKCRKFKIDCDDYTISRMKELAMISCDFAALHGYDYDYGNDASWDQMFEYFDDECAEDNDENDDKPKKNNHNASDDNAAVSSVDKSTNNNVNIPKGMRLGPCYDTVYFGFGTSGECTDGGYFVIGNKVMCVSVNGCPCGESTCQKYGECIDGQCHYNGLYIDLMCYSEKDDDDDDDDDDEANTDAITTDSDGNCACNRTILTPGADYRKEYLCSEYGWMCIKDTGCRCGEISCESGSVCIAPGLCSQPVVACSGRFNSNGECCENGWIDDYGKCIVNGIQNE